MRIEKEQKGYFSIKDINPIIRFLTISDFLILSGWGLVSPIFAIFVVDSIKGGDVKVVGVATAVYLLTKSLAQIPAGAFIDKIKGERDDYISLLIGSFLFSAVPLLYLIVDTPMELYAVQFFYGLAAAIAFPSWYAIFTRHIDKNREGIEWGVYTTLTDLGGSGAAILGGLMAASFGFMSLFIIVSAISFIGSAFLFMVAKSMK